MNTAPMKRPAVAPAGTGFENGELVPITPPEADDDEDRERALRQFLAVALEALFARLLRRTLDPMAVGRRAFALAFAAQHHSVHGMTADELAQRLGVSRQRFWKMTIEVSREWGLKPPQRTNCLHGARK
jgi:hypothetical protein